MATQPDIEAARRLADDLAKNLAQVEGDGPKLQELRTEVESLRKLLSQGQPHSATADRLKGIETAFERASAEVVTDSFTLGNYLAEIGRILGIR
ncbi:MAG TPA: hypothetical protein VN667_11195 [Burkholderiales bacterium]|nr:hypothetical protein [Burkholderiales bacterium]